MGIQRAMGFTIIEVLVAVLVLGLGLIGGAAMQLAALHARHQSTLLSNAVQLASAMADSMRANAEQMQLGDAGNPYLGLDYDAQSDMPAALGASACFSATAHCDSAQMASVDIGEWKRQLRTGVPGGRFVICRDDKTWDDAGKRLDWTCSNAPTAPIVIKLGWKKSAAQGSVSAPVVMLALTEASR
ncbi:MAG: type IV pilus assembly protein PilV [Janthinobacterium sp.]|jgi:type IV pilus assembly protein PilV